jgi:hypothetical protein
VVDVNDCSGVSGCWPMREMKTPLVLLMVLKVGVGTVSLTFFFFGGFGGRLGRS